MQRTAFIETPYGIIGGVMSEYSGKPFIAEFQTSTPSETLELKFFDGTGYNPDNDISKIDWGDGVVEVNPTHTSYRISHVYYSPGTHEIKIFPKKGKLVALYYENLSDKDKIHSVSEWGDYFLVRDAFYGCKNLRLENVEGVPRLDNNISSAFNNCETLFKINNSNEWDFSEVTNTSDLFGNCKNLYELEAENWDLSKVEITSGMFALCSALEYIGTDNWNFENLEESFYMFWYCVGLKEINTFFWKMPNLKDAFAMFADCINLESLNTTTEPEILWKWGLEELEDGGFMFDNCHKLKNIQTSDWNLSKLKFGDGMFKDNHELENIEINGWNINSLENAKEMFLNCYLLNINVEDFDLVNCTDISSFSNNTQFKSICLKNCQNIETIDSYAFNVDVDNLEKVLLEGIQVDFDVSSFNLATKEDLIDLANGNVYNTISYGGVGTVTNKTVTLPDNNFYVGEKAEIELEFSNKGWVVNWVFNQTERPFIAEFKTSTPSETLELNFRNVGAINPNDLAKIDWGDGVVELNPTHVSGRISHVYTTPGTHEIKIFPKKGKLVALHWSNTSDKDKIYSVLDWGDYFLVRNAFHGCTNLELKDAEGVPILEPNLGNAFYNAGMSSIKTFKDWDFSPVTIANNFIRRDESSVNNLTSLDTSNMDLSSMVEFGAFLTRMTLITYIDTSNWDVSSIEDMGNFAWEATNLTINIDFSDPVKGSLNLKETAGFAGRFTQGNEPNIKSIKLIATNIQEPDRDWLTYFKPFRNENIEHLQLIDLNVDWRIQDTPNLDVDEFANSLRDLTGSNSCDIQMSQAQYDACTPDLFTNKNWNIIII